MFYTCAARNGGGATFANDAKQAYSQRLAHCDAARYDRVEKMIGMSDRLTPMK